MASLSQLKSGSRMIQFSDKDGIRRSMRLGKMDKRSAERIRRHVEKLIAASFSDQPIDGETAKWLSECGKKMRSKLANLGLIELQEDEQETEKLTLGPFTDRFIKSRSSVKESTKVVWRRARKVLVKFFGEDREISTITLGEVRDFREFLLEEGRTTAKDSRKTPSPRFFPSPLVYSPMRSTGNYSRRIPSLTRAFPEP